MSYYTTRSKAEILQLIIDYKRDANDYFSVAISEQGGLSPRRVNYKDGNGQGTRDGYCANNGGVTPDGFTTCILSPDKTTFALAWIDRATPTGNDSQYKCPFYSGSLQSDSAFDYLKFENCTPECRSWAQIIGGGKVDENEHNSFPCNLDTLTVYGSEPSYFWYEGNFLEVPVALGLPLFETQADAGDFLIKANAYCDNPTNENLVALQGACAKMVNDGVVPKYSKGDSEPDGYGQLLPDGTVAGVGTFDDTSDTIGMDAKPNVGVSTMGFVNVYKITQGQLQTLGEKLFPHFLPAEILADPSQLTIQDMLAMFIKVGYGTLIEPVGTAVEITDNLGLFDIIMNGKLIDYVIDCHAIPTSISGATVEGLKVGYRQFNDIQVAKANEDYVDIDCGSLSIGEYFASFLDFANVSCDLFLPFVGFVPIDSEYWNGGTLSVKYRVNIVDGSFQARVFATSSKSQLTDTLIGQYGGVACIHYPITGLQYSNVVAGLVNGSASAYTHGSSGDIGGAVASLANMAMLRPDNPMSNGYNASSSFLSHRKPYLVIKRPTPQFSSLYPKEKGVPLNVAKRLSQVKGFTIIENPVLNIACSDSEYNEIVSLMKSGIIL